MAHASEPVGTIDPKEAAHFGKMAAEWWDPRGSSALLHQMNPVRLGYIRDQIDHHWQLDEHDRKPLAGRRALDMRSEEHTSELQSLMRISYAVFCLKKKNKTNKEA